LPHFPLSPSLSFQQSEDFRKSQPITRSQSFALSKPITRSQSFPLSQKFTLSQTFESFTFHSPAFSGSVSFHDSFTFISFPELSSQTQEESSSVEISVGAMIGGILFVAIFVMILLFIYYRKPHGITPDSYSVKPSAIDHPQDQSTPVLDTGPDTLIGGVDFTSPWESGPKEEDFSTGFDD
jgi:hypothetical protein